MLPALWRAGKHSAHPTAAEIGARQHRAKHFILRLTMM
jgi:hypothetical protein